MLHKYCIGFGCIGDLCNAVFIGYFDEKPLFCPFPAQKKQKRRAKIAFKPFLRS